MCSRVMVAASNAVIDIDAIVELDKLKQNSCVGEPRTFYFLEVLLIIELFFKRALTNANI